MYGPKPTSIEAGIYGLIANIYLFDIDTPLKRFVLAHGNPVRHCLRQPRGRRAGWTIHARREGAEALRSPAVIEFKAAS